VGSEMKEIVSIVKLREHIHRTWDSSDANEKAELVEKYRSASGHPGIITGARLSSNAVAPS
jgi:hypothetical protein